MNCKSWTHTFSIGDQVFDLQSQRLATIKEIKLEDDYGVTRRTYQSVNPSATPEDDDTYLVVVVAAPDGESTLCKSEFVLAEEAERFRGFDCLPSDEFEARVKAHGLA